jgi:hypothetical protein
MSAPTWRRVGVVLHEIRASEGELASRFEVTHAFAIEAVDRVAELVTRAGLELRVFSTTATHALRLHGGARRAAIGVSLALVTSALDTPGSSRRARRTSSPRCRASSSSRTA